MEMACDLISLIFLSFIFFYFFFLLTFFLKIFCLLGRFFVFDIYHTAGVLYRD